MTVPVTDLTIRFVTSYSVLFSMAHFMYIRYISTYIALRACMYVCMYVCVCVCIYIYLCVCGGGMGKWVCTCNPQNSKTPIRNRQTLRTGTGSCRLMGL